MINLHQNVFGLFFGIILLSGSIPLGSFADDTTNSTDVNSNEITFDDSDTIQPISIYTEKESYKNGDTIRISGLANTQLDTVSITVRSPSGNIVSSGQHTVSDGVVSTSFVAGGIPYNESGKYSVEAKTKDSRGITYFYYSHDDSAKIESSDVIIRNEDSFCEQENSCFDPHTFEVIQGSSVVWYNADDSHHHIISGTAENPATLLDSGLLYPGDSFEFEFNDMGEYYYFDMENPWRKGKINVTLINHTESYIQTNSTGTVDIIIPTNSTNITSNVIPTNSTIPIITNSTQTNQNILDNYFDSINFTKTNSKITTNSTITASEMIQIDKNVQWTQTITLNQTSKVAIEIPDDAKDVVVINDEEIIPQNNVDIIISEQAESLVKQKTNSTGIETILIDEEESALVSLDGMISVEEYKDTKLAVVENIVSKDAQEIIIQYETPAPYTIEKETDGDDYYEKKVKVKSDSAIHYENVRSYSSIPEEYVLQGIPFTLDWLINGTRVNVINDERFDVSFEDTDGNGLIDRMSWVVPQLSEKVFSINADTAEAEDVSDVPSKLRTMEEKLDGPFYDKTLQMVNAKVMGELDEYLADKREADFTQIIDDYYQVVILVPKPVQIDSSGSNKNKETVANLLTEKFDAKNIYKATHLSFVSAQIPVSKISQLAEYDELHMISDGEILIDFELDTSKRTVKSLNIPDSQNSYDGSGVKVAVIDKGMSNSVALPDSKVIRNIFCNENGCNYASSILPDPTESGHGTHVAGVIAGLSSPTGSPSGVAPGAELINISRDATIFNTDQTKTSFLAQSLDLAVRSGADIANLSFGLLDGACDSFGFNILADEAVDEGLMVIKSAGNNGEDLISHDLLYQTITSPGCGLNVLTVGNLDDNNTSRLSDDSMYPESSKGPTSIPGTYLNPYYQPRMKPEIVAPGTEIFSPHNQNNAWRHDYFSTTTNDYEPLTGTSLSAPHVSGAFAILLEAKPSYTPLETKSALLLGARWDPENMIDLTSRTNNALTAKDYEDVATSTTNTIATTLNSYGFGVLNVEQSIQYATGQNYILRDSFLQQGQTESYEFEVENEHLNKPVKLLLSWHSQPFDSGGTVGLRNIPVSNLDFEITKRGTSTTITSDSVYQNNEFIVFVPTSTGTYDVTVNAKYMPSSIYRSNEIYTISSTIPFDIYGTNTIPSATQPTEEEGIYQHFSGEYYDKHIYLTGTDTSGEILSFYITDYPEHGTLSTILKLGLTSARVIYTPNPNFPDSGDSFSFKVNDGKADSINTATFNLVKGKITHSHQKTMGQDEQGTPTQINLSKSIGQTVYTFDSPTQSIRSIWVESDRDGDLQFSASPTSYLRVEQNDGTLITFDDSISPNNVKFVTQNTESTNYVKLAYLAQPPPTTNYPPVARITVTPDSTVNELTTVTLDGTASTDHETDTNNLAYDWEITQNSAISPVTLSSTDDSTVSFRAPSYDTHPTQEFIIIDLTVTDEGRLSHTASSTITVNSITENTNNLIARNDAYRVPSDGTAHSLDVLNNDHPDKNSLTIQSIGTTGTAGVPSISPDAKSINYIPCSSCSSDSFTYVISDGTTISGAGLVSIVVGNDYQVYSSSRLSEQIKRYDSGGSYQGNLIDFDENPNAITFGGGTDNPDYIYVSQYNSPKLYRFDETTGEPYGYGGSTRDPEILDLRSGTINDIETGSDGFLYVSTSTNKIYKYDIKNNPNNLSQNTFVSSGLSTPKGMAFDSTGKLYVINSGSGDIFRYDSTGTKSTFVSAAADGGMDDPYALAFDNAGNLYVSSDEEEEIYRFNSAGQPYGYGGSSTNAYFTDDDLDEPKGMTVTPDDTLLVANSGDDNILSFDVSTGTVTREPRSSTFASGNGLNEPLDVIIGPAEIPNNPPSIDPISDQTVNENNSITLNINSNDLDGDSITLSLSTKPSFATIQDNNDGTGSVTFAPDYTQSGTYSVTVAASDVQTSDSESFSVVVYDVNRTPVLEDLANTNLSVDAGASTQIEIVAADPDSDGLSFEITQQNNPSSFVILQDNSDGTAQLSIAPPSDEITRTHFVTIRVTDDGTPSLYDEVTFTVIVSANITCGMEITSGNPVSYL
jgi:plastocyanin